MAVLTRSDSATPPATRRRACGRIGGIVGFDDREALEALRGSLGAGAQIVGDEAHALAVDYDACWRRGRPLVDGDEWRAVVREGQLASVSGAFAAAWRDAGGAVSLARDALGERGLFYALARGGLVFASTLHAIVATGLIPISIDAAAVARYLTYAYLPGRYTLVTDIHKLLPGEIARFEHGRLTFDRLWSIPREPDPRSVPDEDALKRQLRCELEAAVLRSLPAGGPVGAFLSGGIDSSLVVALAKRLLRGDVYTYSISFGEGYANELPFSSMVAAHCGTRHRVVKLSPEDIREHLDPCVRSLSDPIGDPLTVPNAMLFREAARDVGVVLTGEGGDPCFGGPKNVPMLLAELLGDGAESDEGAADSHGRLRSYLRAHQKCFDDLQEMLEPDVYAAVAGDVLESEVAPFFSDARWTNLISKLMAINTAFKGPFHILHKVDSVSAPFGTVARSPLFDRAIVESAFAIPPRLKLRGSVEKYLLKEAVCDLLPGAIVERPKSGMLVPVERWFKGPLLADARERVLDGLRPSGLFQRAYLERLVDGRLPGLHPRRGVKIWMLVTLESWLRAVRATFRA